MVDKKDKELTDKDLKKATGGTDERRPVLKRGHTGPGGGITPEADDPVESPTTTSPKTRPATKINPV